MHQALTRVIAHRRKSTRGKFGANASGGVRFGARIAAATLTLSLATALSACTPSPTTSHVNDAGESVTVDWRDYPAAAWLSAEQVLAGPRAGEAPDRFAQMLGEMSLALELAFGAERGKALGDPADYAKWYPTAENGYGGRSMLYTYNSQTWVVDADISDEDRELAVDIVAEIAAKFGLDQRRLDDPSEWDSPERARWLRSESLFNDNSEWLWVSVQDARLDESGEEARFAEQQGWSGVGVSLAYGITTVLDDDRAEFERRAEPFAGLVLPEASHPS
ncbi:MAG: hypothetical protein GX862_10195 [Leucobacter sp.]|nr:hypothetical protein [Leucobacter sp.]